MKNYLSDILILTGCVAITVSSAFISPVLAGFVGGGFCILVGVVLAVANWARERSAPSEGENA